MVHISPQQKLMNFQFFTFFKAKLWAGGVGDSVDTGIGALVREHPVEMLS